MFVISVNAEAVTAHVYVAAPIAFYANLYENTILQVTVPNKSIFGRQTKVR